MVVDEALILASAVRKGTLENEVSVAMKGRLLHVGGTASYPIRVAVHRVADNNN